MNNSFVHDDTPAGGGDAAAHIPSDMERFAARSAERFPFLHPSKLKDAAGVRPGQLGYNPRTLALPPNWFKTQKAGPFCYILLMTVFT